MKRRLEALGSVSRPKPVTVVSPRKSPKTLHDVTVTGETGTPMAAEFKVPPPSRKRKLMVEFPYDYGSVDPPSYKLWLEVDPLWVSASRERQEILSPVAATIESVSDVWKVSFPLLLSPMSCHIFFPWS